MDHKITFNEGCQIKVISNEKPTCRKSDCHHNPWLCKLSASIGAKAIVKKMRGAYVEVIWLDELANEQANGAYCPYHFVEYND